MAKRGKVLDLSLREKICQCIIIRTDPELHRKQYGSIENFLKKYPVGGIFVGNEVCPYNEQMDIKNSIIEEYQKYSKIPLLVCMDGENGVSGEGTHSMPSPLCIGASDNEDLAYRYSATIAKETAGSGINWTFAPVVDLSINPLNLLVTQRVLGDDADKVAHLLPSFIKGYQENGLLCTAKHFPGDGVDYRNQHIVKSENSLSRDEWFKQSGKMFKTAIDAGVDAIMAGHISAPAFQGDAVDGMYPPATLSYDLITKLLKETLGFKGVVVSDALDMGGFLRWIYEQDEAEIKCFEAGCDMLLWPQLRVVDNIEERIKSGKIPMSRLDDALSRILSMKSKIKETSMHKTTYEYAEKTVSDLAQKGTYLLKNNIIPINADTCKKVRIVGIATNLQEEKKMLEILKDEFEKHGAKAETMEDWCNYHADFDTVNKDYDLLIYAYLLEPDVPNPIGRPAVTIHNSLVFDREKTIIASFSSPYVFRQYCETAKTYVNSYKNEESLRTFVRGVYGECEFSGNPSVKVL
jgi:beta-N-acetylhexosaminidase